MMGKMNNDNKINGLPATDAQFQRVLFLQEKKRRIQAEAQLLVHEEQVVDAELNAILASVEAAAKAMAEEGTPES